MEFKNIGHGQGFTETRQLLEKALAAIERARNAVGDVDPLSLEKNLSALQYFIRRAEGLYDPRFRTVFYETVESALELEAPAFKQLANRVGLLFQSKRIPF